MTRLDPDYVAGRAAHHDGAMRDANPHPPDSARATRWRLGWDDGELEWAPAWRSCWPEDMGL